MPFRFHFWDGAGSVAAAFVDWWNEQRALVGLGPEPRPPTEHVWYRNSRALTLILGLPELVEPKGILPRYALRVGPTVWEPPLPRPLPQWVGQLGSGRPAVLASVSTVGAADAQFAATVGQAVAGEDIDVVLTVAADGTLPPLPANVRVVPFISHGALLPHVSAVVSHAGNGTVTRAACAGVPLLLIPGGRDQHEVARRRRRRRHRAHPRPRERRRDASALSAPDALGGRALPDARTRTGAARRALPRRGNRRRRNRGHARP